MDSCVFHEYIYGVSVNKRWENRGKKEHKSEYAVHANLRLVEAQFHVYIYWFLPAYCCSLTFSMLEWLRGQIRRKLQDADEAAPAVLWLFSHRWLTHSLIRIFQNHIPQKFIPKLQIVQLCICDMYTHAIDTDFEFSLSPIIIYSPIFFCLF